MLLVFTVICSLCCQSVYCMCALSPICSMIGCSSSSADRQMTHFFFCHESFWADLYETLLSNHHLIHTAFTIGHYLHFLQHSLAYVTLRPCLVLRCFGRFNHKWTMLNTGVNRMQNVFSMLATYSTAWNVTFVQYLLAATHSLFISIVFHLFSCFIKGFNLQHFYFL